MDILNRIAELRDIRGWSNYRLSKKADISETIVNNLFRCNHTPTISTLESLCKGFGITLAEFFVEDGDAIVLNSEQIELLKIWDTLSMEKKKSLLEFLKSK